MTDYSNRIKKFYKSVKLPTVYAPQDRGYDSCCCKHIVFGSADNDLYKNNKTSAWIRDVDTWRFYLVKESTGEEIEIDSMTPIRDVSARYCTVDWSTILFAYGNGCYTLKIDSNIAGIVGTQIWGEYELVEFSLHFARRYVSFRTTLNSLQTIENINFRDSNVIDCINVPGIFGFANPNTQIENTVYSDRTTKKVVRENVYEYEFNSDPLLECQSKKLFDLHFLSENEILVSDFNPMNHTNYLNTPCIFEGLEKPEYIGNLVNIKSKFGDKTKNKRSRYGV